LLLIVDQFEELFIQGDDDRRRSFIIDSLIQAIAAPRTPLRIIITLRADFYDRPLQYESLGRLLKENTEVILPLTSEELTWAMHEPARRVGVTLEEGLAEAIVGDLADQPGALPLLQYALTELFERRQNGAMHQAAYREIGGVLGALGRRAEEIYSTLDESGRESARQLFLRLVTLGEGAEDTRRRVLRSELEAIGAGQQLTINGEQRAANDSHSSTPSAQPQDPINNSQLDRVIDAYNIARLLTFDHHPVTRQATVEVAHEALLREWIRLRGWLDESRNEVRLQRMLAAAANEWQAAGRAPGFLLRDARLDQFAGWAETASVALTGDEQAYLEASINAHQSRVAEEEARLQRELETAQKLAETEHARAEEQAQSARMLRRRAAFFAAALVLAALLAVAAFFFARQSIQNAAVAEENADEALDQKAIAEQQALVAQSRELAAASFLSQNTDPELGLLLASQALSTAETGEAEQALHSALLASRVRQRLVGHQAAIQRLAYSPDGRLIAMFAAGEDLATIWDAVNGRLLHEIPNDRCCWGLFFDDEGERLVAAEPGENFSLAIWDMVTGEKLESFPLPISNSEIGGYYLNPDWTRAAIFLKDETLSVWDIQAGMQLFDLPGHTGWVEMEYSKDGRRLVTYDSSDGLVLVWDAGTGKLVRRLETGEFINDHAVSPDGRVIALAVENETEGWHVQLWDIDAPPGDEGLSPSETLTGHLSVIRLIDFSADGRMVASASGDGTSQIWDTVTGETLLVLPHGVHVRSVVFHPDGHSLLSSDLDGVARVWDIRPEGSSERLGLMANDAASFEVDVSPDGTTLATGGAARLWDLATGKLRQSLDGHDDIVMSVDFHPDGGRVATASADGTARVWDTATGEQLFIMDGHGEGIAEDFFPGVLSVDYHPDGDRLATAGADGTARIWDSRNGEELMVLEGHTNGLTTVAFSPDGNYLATAQRSGNALNVEEAPVTVRIWDAETGQGLFSFDSGHGEHAWELVFSPDGRFLATSGDDAMVRLWALDFDAGRAELIETLTNHTTTVFGTRFSPDGRTLATASPLLVRLWDLTPLVDGAYENSIVELLVLPGGGALAYSPDGSELITGGRDGLVRVYLLDNTELMELAESRLTRTLTKAECRQYLHTDACPTVP
jgi:WD40 repeat protein